jgi:hypothetical protein
MTVKVVPNGRVNHQLLKEKVVSEVLGLFDDDSYRNILEVLIVSLDELKYSRTGRKVIPLLDLRQ